MAIYFTIKEMTKSQTAELYYIDNTPTEEVAENEQGKDMNGMEKTQKRTIIQNKEHTLHYQSITNTNYLQRTKGNNYGYTGKPPEKSLQGISK